MGSAMSLMERIALAVGEENCEADPKKMAEYAIGGVAPLIIVWPGCEEELRRIIELAREAGKAILPVGGMTKVNTGLPPRGDFVLVCLTRLSGPVDYDPSNLTISARAGTRLNALQAFLEKEGQFLPVDPPFASESSLGGILASNASGPLSLSYGGARDLALGLRVMLSDGRTLRCGSKTVKNVAGYDMVKLFVGSWGTLGVACDATFRVSPLPERRGALAASFKGLDGALAAAKGALKSRLAPSYLTVLSSGTRAGLEAAGDMTRGEAPVFLVIGADGFEEAVKAHLREAAIMCAKSGAIGCAELFGDEERALRRKAEEYPALFGLDVQKRAIFRASVPISKVPDFLSGLGSIAAKERVEWEYVANPGLGWVAASLTLGWGDQAADSLASALKQARGLAKLCSGHFLLERASPNLKIIDGVWGDIGPKELSLMRAIKAKMDPYNLFSPGRFIGGI